MRHLDKLRIGSQIAAAYTMAEATRMHGGGAAEMQVLEDLEAKMQAQREQGVFKLTCPPEDHGRELYENPFHWPAATGYRPHWGHMPRGAGHKKQRRKMAKASRRRNRRR